MQNQNIPNVRFNDFIGEWKTDVISNLADRFDNLRVPVTASNRIPGKIPYYGANGVQDYVEGFTHDGEYVLVAEDGANDLRNYPVNFVVGKVWVNNHAHVLSGKANKLSNHFLKDRLKTINFERYLVGGSRAKLNADILMKIPVSFPSLPEQSAIGQLFSTLDDLLSAHKDNLSNYQTFKSTMLSKMFPKHGQTFPEIRLAGFDGEWENVNLGDLVVEHNEIVQGTTGFPIATSFRKGLFLQNEYFDGGRTGIDESIQFHLVPIGYITYQHMSDDSIFKFNRNHYKTDILVSKEYPVFKNNEKSDIDFILYHLNNCPEFRRFSRIQKLGGTRVRLYFKNLVAYKLLIPTLNEQQAIGSFFSNLDDLISSTQSKIEELETLKKKLLQGMFV
ncbi:restriction endonuclease subunit S [Streptococcus sobrinus]|uniref:restriction endonuclease subunit S n=1 Tax=Streptococcus sobrinus TaxID=1310 RepID=UPI000D705E17|nr:restriction endonuclease subunit S [Streptococcus sobrinus]AWN61769.1 restriction endonuclease subunit S [Streptococcus sobrinus]AWN63640.1 restriction endonuclease subunit S [Streptococcus sobrinus]SQG20302.1 HsdS specificity protein of type I restriction-modification system [Streptococcus sobrinus]